MRAPAILPCLTLVALACETAESTGPEPAATEASAGPIDPPTAAETPADTGFVGATTHDMLLAPPPGANVTGERVLDRGVADADDHSKHMGLVLARHEGGPWALWLDRMQTTDSGEHSFVVEAELVLPAGTDIGSIAWDDCESSGALADVPAGHVVGLVDPDAPCDEAKQSPTRAWTIADTAPYFSSVDDAELSSITCTAPRCVEDRLTPDTPIYTSE